MSLTHGGEIGIVYGADRGQNLVAATIGYLRRCDEPGLVAELEAHWTPDELVALLNSNSDETAKVAATCLGAIGTWACCPALAAALRHDDSVVVAVAELALWQIWFRAGPSEACCRLYRAAHLMADERYRESVSLLDRIVADAPDFAEAYNQRAIAHYLTDRFVEAASDCRRALRLNHLHFAALAGLGHCLAHLGRLPEALEAYYGALNIHPRMNGVRQSITQIRSILGRPRNASAGPTTHDGTCA